MFQARRLAHSGCTYNPNAEIPDGYFDISDIVREDIEVGEVRPQVTVRNAGDLMLARQGLRTAADVRACTEIGVVDTGAVGMVIPRRVADVLGVPVVRRCPVRFADGKRSEAEVVGPIEVELLGRTTSQDAYVLGNEILIGQTALESTDLWVDCKGKRLVPNPNHPDGPEFRV